MSTISATDTVLDEAEVAKRRMLLTELQAVLATSGIRCVVAGRQRLVLRYSEPPPHALSGPVDPALYVLSPAENVVTTECACYRLRDGREFPVTDRVAVAAAIRA